MGADQDEGLYGCRQGARFTSEGAIQLHQHEVSHSGGLNPKDSAATRFGSVLP